MALEASLTILLYHELVFRQVCRYTDRVPTLSNSLLLENGVRALKKLFSVFFGILGFKKKA